MLVWAGSACVFLWFPSDKVAVDSAARTVWVPLLRRRRLASLERPEQVEGGCHFLWLLSDDCVSVKGSECVWLWVHMCLFACECIGVCRSYFINVFLSHLLQQRGKGEECVFVCQRVHGLSVLMLFRKHHVFCSEARVCARMQMMFVCVPLSCT